MEPTGLVHSALIHAAFHLCPRTWSRRLASKQTNRGVLGRESEAGEEQGGEAGEGVGERGGKGDIRDVRGR